MKLRVMLRERVVVKPARVASNGNERRRPDDIEARCPTPRIILVAGFTRLYRDLNRAKRQS